MLVKLGVSVLGGETALLFLQFDHEFTDLSKAMFARRLQSQLTTVRLSVDPAKCLLTKTGKSKEQPWYKWEHTLVSALVACKLEFVLNFIVLKSWIFYFLSKNLNSKLQEYFPMHICPFSWYNYFSLVKRHCDKLMERESSGNDGKW